MNNDDEVPMGDDNQSQNAVSETDEDSNDNGEKDVDAKAIDENSGKLPEEEGDEDQSPL